MLHHYVICECLCFGLYASVWLWDVTPFSRKEGMSKVERYYCDVKMKHFKNKLHVHETGVLEYMHQAFIRGNGAYYYKELGNVLVYRY